MIQDLHAHTYYSFDSEDKIEKVIETALLGGVGLIGISDHNYGIGWGRSFATTRVPPSTRTTAKRFCGITTT